MPDHHRSGVGRCFSPDLAERRACLVDQQVDDVLGALASERAEAPEHRLAGKRRMRPERHRAARRRAPLRTPESNSTVAREPTCAATAGSTSIGAGSASIWRPPWFETQTPSMPSETAVSASAGCMMPLSTSGFFHLSRKRAISSQVKAPPISLRAKLITSFVPAFSPA